MSSLKVLMLCQHTQGELEWSKEVRGYVLSSFYYGYVVTQVLGGWLAGRYGGKHVFGTSILITAIATIIYTGSCCRTYSRLSTYHTACHHGTCLCTL